MMNQEKCANGRQSLGWVPFSGCFSNATGSNQKKPPRKASQGFFLTIMLVLSIPLLWNSALAAEVSVTPGLSVGGAYDDNIFLTTEDKVNSSIITVSPSLEVDYQTLLSSLSLKADFDILSYLDESDLDRTNQYYRLSGDHRFKERWTTSAAFKYERDTTLNTYLQETGRVIDRVESDYFDGYGRVYYDLTRVDGVSLDYRYKNVSYEDDVFPDFDSHSSSIYYYHRLKNELDTLLIGPYYYHRNGDDNDVDSIVLNVGWDRDWTSITKSSAYIGARYTTVTDNDGTEDNNWGVKASVEITSIGVASNTTFKYYHDLRTTVDGIDINVDNFYLTYRRLLTERFGVGINGRLVFSYKLLDRDSDIDDQRYYWVEPNLYYRLTEHLNLSLRYRYQNNVEIADDGDITRERNIFWLQLSYGFPILL
jgi:hypothetical protein